MRRLTNHLSVLEPRHYSLFKAINWKLTFEIPLKVTQFAHYKIFCHVEELLQQPHSKISGTESPDSAAFDVEGERVECPLKTPKIVTIFLIHPDMVELTTGLWGWTKLKRSWHSSKVFHFSDFLRYSFKTATIHKLLSSSKKWKTAEGCDFTFLHDFWSLWKVKAKLVGVFTMKLMFRCCKPSAREADVRTINIVNL